MTGAGARTRRQDAASRSGLSTAGAAAAPILAGAGLLVAIWALLPPQVGPQLALGPRGPRLELVDHTVPAVVVIVSSLLSLIAARRARPGASTVLFAAGLAVALAGLWMTATHLPLVLQAARHQASWSATLNHTLPSVAVLLTGIRWSTFYRSRGPGSVPSRG